MSLMSNSLLYVCVQLCLRYNVQSLFVYPVEWDVKIVSGSNKNPMLISEKSCRCKKGLCKSCVCFTRGEKCGDDCHGGDINKNCTNC